MTFSFNLLEEQLMHEFILALRTPYLNQCNNCYADTLSVSVLYIRNCTSDDCYRDEGFSTVNELVSSALCNVCIAVTLHLPKKGWFVMFIIGVSSG